jgi:hypothetical protein
MNEEELENSLLLRPSPRVPYTPTGALLVVPSVAWEQTLAVFTSAAARRVEACCFWYGVRDQDRRATVHAVIVPKQRNTWGNYHIPAAAMAEVAAASRPEGWVNLSQIHTHPGHRVEHSRYDDAHANSRRALSLVLPYYGRWQGVWPRGIGVHEFQNDYWHFLSDADAERRVIVGGTEIPARLVYLR